MQNKNKKILLNLVFISAIALGITSLFVPTTRIDYSDLYEDSGYTNIERYAVLESSPILTRYVEYDFSKSNAPSENHRYSILTIFHFESGEPVKIKASVYLNDTDYVIESYGLIDMFSMIYVVFEIVLTAILFLLLYRGFKNMYQKNRYFLYLGLVSLVIFVLTIIAIYYTENLADINNLGYTNYLTFQYGFYLGIVAIILFFTAHILQNYFIEHTEQEKNPIDESENVKDL